LKTFLFVISQKTPQTFFNLFINPYRPTGE
jgi:hypothetical protein